MPYNITFYVILRLFYVKLRLIMMIVGRIVKINNKLTLIYMEVIYKLTILEYGYEKSRHFETIDKLNSWLIGINNLMPNEHPSVTNKKEIKLPNGDRIISYMGNGEEKVRAIITTIKLY